MLDGAGTSLREYIYWGNQQIALISNGTTYYVHNDHLNTPQVITNQNQQVVWIGDYEPFGKVASNVNNSTEIFSRFPGQYLDSETGLYYNYFRDYDPSIGRYIESDPIGLEGGINTYAYVSGNPLLYNDVYGLSKTIPAPGIPIIIPGTIPNTGGFDNFFDPAAPNDSARSGTGPDCECPTIEANIQSVASELRVRYIEAMRDEHDLFNLAYDKAALGKRRGSWLGHKQRFQDKQKQLQKLIAQADAKGCYVYPTDRDISTAPFPSMPAAR